MGGYRGHNQDRWHHPTQNRRKNYKHHNVIQYVNIIQLFINYKKEGRL